MNTRAGFDTFLLNQIAENEPFWMTLLLFIKIRFTSIGVLIDITYEFGKLNVLLQFRKGKGFAKSQRLVNLKKTSGWTSFLYWTKY